jgi:hypothetical protein
MPNSGNVSQNSFFHDVKKFENFVIKKKNLFLELILLIMTLDYDIVFLKSHLHITMYCHQVQQPR